MNNLIFDSRYMLMCNNYIIISVLQNIYIRKTIQTILNNILTPITPFILVPCKAEILNLIIIDDAIELLEILDSFLSKNEPLFWPPDHDHYVRAYMCQFKSILLAPTISHFHFDKQNSI